MMISDARRKLLGRLELGLRLDQARALLTQRFRLLRHGALHRFRDLDILHFHALDLDAPGLGDGVDLALNDARDGLLLFQHLVERMLADAGAQRRERDLDDGEIDVFHLDHRELGIDDAIPDHRVHLDRTLSFGDRLLLLNGGRVDAQVDRLLPFDQRMIQ